LRAELEKGPQTCNASTVVRHCNNFVAILIAVLTLGVGTPQTLCAAAVPSPAACCCCSESCGASCQPEKPCPSSCKAAQVQTFDQQLPGRALTGASIPGAHLLFLLTGVKVTYPAFVSVVRPRDVNVSPPFGGRPPQAVLRLWLI
jgi:hypothetical protein